MKPRKIFLSLFLIFLIFIICALGGFLLSLRMRSDKSIEPEPLEKPTEPSISLPTVIIDAGHGGEDGGAVGKNGAYEKDINLEISKKLKARLEALGIPCELTRSEDILLYDRNADFEGKKKKLDLLARYEFASKYQNAVFISIHQNSFPKEQYDGFQVYYSPNNEASSILAELLEKSVTEALPETRCRESKAGTSSIYLLDKLSCPAVLVECGFISNEAECSRLCDEEYQNKLCKAIATATAELLGVK